MSQEKEENDDLAKVQFPKRWNVTDWVPRELVLRVVEKEPGCTLQRMREVAGKMRLPSRHWQVLWPVLWLRREGAIKKVAGGYYLPGVQVKEPEPVKVDMAALDSVLRPAPKPQPPPKPKTIRDFTIQLAKEGRYREALLIFIGTRALFLQGQDVAFFMDMKNFLSHAAGVMTRDEAEERIPGLLGGGAVEIDCNKYRLTEAGRQEVAAIPGFESEWLEQIK